MLLKWKPSLVTVWLPTIYQTHLVILFHDLLIAA